jgi:transposase-like protein
MEHTMQSKRTRWAGHVAAWQSSGLSQSAYCRRQGLSLASFGYWRRQLRTHEPEADVPVTQALVPIQVAPTTASLSSPGMEVCLSNGGASQASCRLSHAAIRFVVVSA